MNIAKIPLNLNKVKNDPLGFITDKIIAFIANFLIPIPLSGEIIAKFKRPIMGLLVTLIIFALFMVTVVGTIFLSPLLLGSSVIENISSLFQNPSDIAIDASFGDTAVPKKNPLGGNGMAYLNVTAYFLDPSYYLQFGRNHTGIDMVPAQEYYKNSQTYQDTHQVVIFATISGSVNQYVDQYGGETVEITNSDKTFKILYIHFSTILVDNGTKIKSGTPIGIMGNTGFSTGDHLHYEVKIKDGNSWRAVNPLEYIK